MTVFGVVLKIPEIKHKKLNMWLILTGLISSYALSVTPQIVKAKIFTTGSTQGNKNSALRVFKKLKFLQKWEIPRVCTFGPTLTPFFLLKKMAKFF